MRIDVYVNCPHCKKETEVQLSVPYKYGTDKTYKQFECEICDKPFQLEGTATIEIDSIIAIDEGEAK